MRDAGCSRLDETQKPVAWAYTAEYYDEIRDGALRSARVVSRLISEYISPESVVDFGCGTGAWLAAFEELGVRQVVGVDFASIPDEILCIEASEFVQHDLTQELHLGRRFDLILCLETGEHLPESAAPVLVRSLANHGDVIAFSAAAPG